LRTGRGQQRKGKRQNAKGCESHDVAIHSIAKTRRAKGWGSVPQGP
jgi:hypothetical protein